MDYLVEESMCRVRSAALLLMVSILLAPVSAVAQTPSVHAVSYNQQDDGAFHHGIAFWQQGKYADALVAFEDALSAARQAEDRESESLVSLHMVLVHLFQSVELAMNGSWELAIEETLPMLRIADQLAILEPNEPILAEAIYIAAEQLLQNYLALSGADFENPPINIDRMALRIADGYHALGIQKREAIVLDRILFRGTLGSTDEGGIDADTAATISQRAFDAFLAVDDFESAARVHWNRGDALKWTEPQTALETYAAAVALLLDDQESRLHADILYDMGEVYQQLGEMEEAIASFQHASLIYQKLDALSNASLALQNVGSIYDMQGEYRAAIDSFLQVEELNDRGVRWTDFSLGLDNLRQLLQLYERIDVLDTTYPSAEALRAKIARLEADMDSGINLDALSILLETYLEWLHEDVQASQNDEQIRAEIALFENALHTLQNLNEENSFVEQEYEFREEFFHLINTIGVDQRTAGRYESALRRFEQKLQLQHDLFEYARAAGIGRSLMGEGTLAAQYQLPIADTLVARAEVHELLGDYKESIDLYEEMIGFIGELGGGRYMHSRDVSMLDKYLRIGDIYRALGRYKDATRWYMDVKDRIIYGFFYFSASVYIPDADVTSQAFQRIGSMSLEEGNFNAALIFSYSAYLNLYLLSQHHTLPSAHEIEEERQVLVANIFAQIGDAYRAQHKPVLMEQAYTQAVTLYENFVSTYPGRDEQASTVLINLGTIQARLGSLSSAVSTYQNAIDLVEDIQGELRVEEWKTGYISNQSDLYARLIDLLYQDGQIAEAFDYAERGLARVFLDQIGNQRIDFASASTPELIEQEQQLSQLIIGLQNALKAEREKPEEQQNQTVRQELSAELEERRDDYDELLAEIKLNNPEYAALVSVATIGLVDVQEQVLDDETTLVEYLTLDDYAFAWVIDKEHVGLVQLDLPRQTLSATVEFLRAQIEFRENVEVLSSQLYAHLVAPLKPHLQNENLIIVPHGPLHYLPFGALWNGNDEKYFVEEYTLTYAPSASVLKFIQQKRNQNDGRMLIMGNPDRSLPNAQIEVQQIADLFHATPFINEQATEEEFYHQLAQDGPFDYLHLAAHGVYEPFNPLATRIELTTPDADVPPDGNLEVHEVFGLNLTGTNLVTLSACETAKGELSDGGELLGLTRAFLYAGTPAVITTLWKVSDEASGELMQAFYRNLRTGMATTAALQTAQQTILAQEQWQNPYYWAAFNLTGDYLGRN